MGEVRRTFPARRPRHRPPARNQRALISIFPPIRPIIDERPARSVGAGIDHRCLRPVLLHGKLLPLPLGQEPILEGALHYGLQYDAPDQFKSLYRSLAFYLQTSTFLSGAEGIRTPDLRRAKAVRWFAKGFWSLQNTCKRADSRENALLQFSGYHPGLLHGCCTDARDSIRARSGTIVIRPAAWRPFMRVST